MPIIELQRRMVEAGRIRAGEKSERGAPKKLDKWRLTSKDRVRLEAAAVKWGGEVKPWNEQWELYTDTDSLEIMLTPETEATLWYELYSAAGCLRRCDGVTEHLSDSPCLCEEGNRECKPTLRFQVLLPDLPGIGHWLVQSHGFNAAREIPGAIHMLSGFIAQGIALPARLRLEQRQDVKNGQTRKYAVPVVDIDVSLRELLGSRQIGPGEETLALPSGYTPIGNGGNGQGVSLAEGLEQAESEGKVSSRTVPLPEVDAEFGEEPIAVESADPAPVDAAGSAETLKPTKRQLDKLNVLVGQLREAGAIQTVHLWSALATSRNVDVDVMCDLLKGREDGEWHWAPLRDDMNRREASDLIDRLERLEKNVGAAA